MENLPKTRAEAKALGSKFYFTGKPCKHGHTEKRRANDGVCALCAKAHREENREKYRERAREYNREYYKKNREKINKRVREHRKRTKQANSPT